MVPMSVLFDCCFKDIIHKSHITANTQSANQLYMWKLRHAERKFHMTMYYQSQIYGRQ